jgi:signal transduction histidine kinase
MMISVSGRPLDPSAGQPGAVAIFHDITALREQAAELRAFAGVAAHDLRTPLAAVAGFAELLQDDLTERFGDDLGPQAAHYLGRMTTGLDRMQKLITDLLTFSAARDRPLHLEPVDLQTLVTAVVSERTAHLRTGTLFPDVYTGALPAVRADAAMMHQLMDHLIGNALKYTLPGQAARIDISAHSRSGDGHVRIEIADRGIGIPGGQHDEIVKSFHRAHSGGPKGSGLGLAICQRIAGRHGGTIAVSDNPGGGTRVAVTLPLAPAAAEPATAEPTAEPATAEPESASAPPEPR